MKWQFGWTMAVALLAVAAGCDRSPAKKPVVLYTSVDEPIVRPIIEEFKKTTGIDIALKTDTEASKTMGLVASLRAEKANPRCDVFWNNEIFHTINLASEGVLTPYASPAARDVPPQFKDPLSRWAASGLRIRMIARAPSAGNVNTIEDLLDPALKDKICMGGPALGTIAGQMGALFVEWGPVKAEKFLQDLRANGVKIVGGNSEVVKQVAAGTMLAGLTDNDDVDAMIQEGGKLTGVAARSKDNGALAIPVTVGLVAGGPNPEDAKKLIDYLLSPAVEKKLIDARYAARSVRATGATQPGEVMKVDYADVARVMPKAVETARKVLEDRK